MRAALAAWAVALGFAASSPHAQAERLLRVNVVADPAMIDPITYSELVAGSVMKPMYEGFTRTARMAAASRPWPPGGRSPRTTRC